MSSSLIRPATASDADAVANLVFALLEELAAPELPGIDRAGVVRTAHDLLQQGRGVWAFLAEIDRRAVGVITLNECAAIYAGGRFGEICELFVEPPLRSAAVGRRLIDAAVDFARTRQWTRLEVGTEHPPRWQRSIDFYVRCGFVEIGPRLKLDLRSRA